MTFKDYQEAAVKTAIYRKDYSVIYPALGLANEAGEVLGKIKKVLRDTDGFSEVTDEKRLEIGKEIGDVLWYIAALARDLRVDLDDIAIDNIAKLKSRQERGVLHGSGDDR